SDVPATTLLTGSFVAPSGAWPGGGEALLVRRATPPRGGLMGLFTSGMELARQQQSGGSDDRAREIETELEAWVGRAEPLAVAPVDPSGHFAFREPEPGDWAIELRHEALRVQSAVPVAVVAGRHADCGEIGTAPAA